jgi:hypothetical protein
MLLALLIPLIILGHLRSKNIIPNEPRPIYLKNSLPLKSMPELESVIMKFVGVDIEPFPDGSGKGNAVFMIIDNNTEHWIKHLGLVFSWDNMFFILEYLDIDDWKMVPVVNNLYPPLVLSLPISPFESFEHILHLEMQFGILESGFYRVRLSYAITDSMGTISGLNEEEWQQLMGIDLYGPHEVVAEFYWDY